MVRRLLPLLLIASAMGQTPSLVGGHCSVIAGDTDTTVHCDSVRIDTASVTFDANVRTGIGSLVFDGKPYTLNAVGWTSSIDDDSTILKQLDADTSDGRHLTAIFRYAKTAQPTDSGMKWSLSLVRGSLVAK